MLEQNGIRLDIPHQMTRPNPLWKTYILVYVSNCLMLVFIKKDIVHANLNCLVILDQRVRLLELLGLTVLCDGSISVQIIIMFKRSCLHMLVRKIGWTTPKYDSVIVKTMRAARPINSCRLELILCYWQSF